MQISFFEKYSIDNEIIAVGVSGGADSLALALRLKDCGKKIIALTVDHGLRPSSRIEAEYVAKLMNQYNIEHHILTWQGQKPRSDIEAIARQKRYELLFEWCHINKIKTLAIGHHRRDQAETFLLRLQRGSGLDGLCCMQPITQREGICIIRPQLNDNPEDIKNYLRKHDIKWIEDESNQCEDFQRVKIRKFLPELMQKIDLSERRLAETAAILSRTRNYLEFETNKIIKNHVRYFENCAASVSPSIISKLHDEMAYRLLGRLICEIGYRIYTPESNDILRLVSQTKLPDFKGATLGGCEIFVAQKRLWLVPEVHKKQILAIKDWQKCLQNLPQYAKANLPYKVRRAIFNHLQKNNHGKK